jgi:hypothetical protein
MRLAGMLLALLALCACSVTTDMVPGQRSESGVPSQRVTIALARAPQPAVTPREMLDVSAVVRSAVAVPALVERLERAIVVWCAILAVVGLLNATLLLRLLATRREAPSPARAAAPAVASGTAPPAKVALGAHAACSCGAAISPRTASGRCRTCASHARAAARRSAAGRREIAARTNEPLRQAPPASVR